MSAHSNENRYFPERGRLGGRVIHRSVCSSAIRSQGIGAFVRDDSSMSKYVPLAEIEIVADGFSGFELKFAHAKTLTRLAEITGEASVKPPLVDEFLER